MASAHERTEEATPKHRAKVRARGGMARSQLAAPALSLVVAAPLVFALAAHAGSWRQAFVAATEACKIHGTSLDVMMPIVWAHTIGSVARPWHLVAVCWLLASFVGVLASLACGSLGFAPGASAPRFARLTASMGLRRLASLENVWHACSSGLVLALIAWLALPPMISNIQTAARMGDLARSVTAMERGAATAWGRASAVLLVFAAIDVMVTRKRFAASLRMTPRELRDERAESETRPEVKQRRKTVGARRSRGLRVAAIKKATAIITNPTHLAIALRYAPPEIDVPIVVARGADLTAEIVRAAAHEFEVPIVESADLARTLYAMVEVDEPIPEECYAAVAAIFAWIVRTRGSLRGRDPQPE